MRINWADQNIWVIVLLTQLEDKKSPQRGIRQCIHMYICLYCTVQQPGASLASVEAALTFV